MRLHRFYFPEKIGDKKEIAFDSADFVHQIRKVFRLKSGDEVILFDGSGSDYLCKLHERENVLSIISVSHSRYMPQKEVYLFASIIKKDNFEWIVEKATELGVTHIVPIISERSEKKALNMERLEKIAMEASEQSGRGNVPFVEGVIDLEKALDSKGKYADVLKDGNVLAFHTNESANRFVQDQNIVKPQAIFIGPEGGWSPKEVEMFNKNKIGLVSLGNQVLRAETAVVAALSKVLL